MMKVVVAFIASVICTVAGQPPTAPPPCCMATNFTAVLTDLQTINEDNISVMYLTLDFAGQREAVISTVFNTATRQTTKFGRTVFDFSAGKQYYIAESDPNSCSSSTLNWSLPNRCVPSGAQYLGSNYLGLPATLNYDAWRFPFGSGTNAELTMVFSRDGCVPILEGVLGDLNGPQNKQYLFSSYNANSADPSVFSLPASCNQ